MMNGTLTNVKELDKLGDLATQGEWNTDTGGEVITDNGCTVAYPKDEMFKDKNFFHNTAFITAAANSRKDIKALIEDAERMRSTLEDLSIGVYTYQVTQNKAKQALNGNAKKGKDDE